MQEHWTIDDLKKYASGGHVPKRPATPRTDVSSDIEPNALTHASNHRQSSPRGVMNKTESRYSGELELLKRAGEIEFWAFEPITLRLAKRTSYTPDFFVKHKDGTLEFVETKGHWEDDARVKIKVAAKMFPMFKFTALTPTKGGGWKREDF